MVLQPFLDKFRGHKGDGISYVQANWQAAQGQDPIINLVGYWAPMDERDESFFQTAATKVDWPIVPAPLSVASLISEAEILLADCRDDDMELCRLHEDF
ncbi:hypothetical protein R1sor_019056 [Riccia sorocarpa]|uniref:Uncharacterized protein n=1 Tax=Riccia sorocarpa TaxID=122646 RepID=A0ABD3ID65_9MARC